MDIPQGVIYAKPNQVCKLYKSLYGLKQVGRQWYTKLSNSLKELGYVQSTHDHSLFTKNANQCFTALLIYVDDLVLSGNDIHDIMMVKKHLDKLFKIKDLGNLKYFLGLEVARSKSGIILCQRKHALDILADTGFLAARPVSTPMVKTTKLHHDNTSPFEDASLYRRYIKGSPCQEVFYSSTYSLQLKAFSDSDWAACIDSRKSITGYCVFLGDSLVSWRSKK
ncbi:PREDICTED: uncharacterized protein LOC109344667 [Lupinus angustifolius]|uniref:uncharacterized protein LOC109344667 n=1 Tax=Lupinus angustifolius TaxID=3871 RepID=UPI00092F4281|nr:PREDICTED: uncharacterized protein LOC109344667 [Lupinus angustifolius]